jgi:hypothetical protein
MPGSPAIAGNVPQDHTPLPGSPVISGQSGGQSGYDTPAEGYAPGARKPSSHDVLGSLRLPGGRQMPADLKNPTSAPNGTSRQESR